MKKRILAAFLSFLLAVTTLPVSAWARERIHRNTFRHCGGTGNTGSTGRRTSVCRFGRMPKAFTFGRMLGPRGEYYQLSQRDGTGHLYPVKIHYRAAVYHRRAYGG